MIGVDPTIRLVAQAYMNHVRKLLSDKGVDGIPIVGSVSSFRSAGKCAFGLNMQQAIS